MTTVLVALAGALATLALVGGAVLVARWARREQDVPEERVEAAIKALEAQMGALVRDLASELEDARAEARRSRFLGQLGGSLDVDEVVERTLEAAQDVAGADAALLRVTGPEPVEAATGLSDQEVAAQPVIDPPRAMSFELEAEEGEIRAGVLVPVTFEGASIGSLAVLARVDRPFDRGVLGELHELARHAGPALENARRFREARQLADIDALTGLHNRRYFHETLQRECARAQRYGRRMSIVVLDVDDFKAINDRVGHLAGDAVLAEVAARVQSVVRTADVACRVGGDELAVVLPESGIEEAEQLAHRLQAAVRAKPIAAAGRVYISAGAAELTPDEDANTLFERADDALYRSKQQGGGRLAANDA